MSINSMTNSAVARQPSVAAGQRPVVALADWDIFFGLLAATPVVLWLVFAAKLKGAQKALPIAPRQWPLWEMFAASVAFTAWVFALPATPFWSFSWYSPAIGSVAVLVTSASLGLLAPLFQAKLAS